MKRIVALFSSVLLCLGLSTVIASPAQAWFNCPNTSQCAFQDIGGLGNRLFENDYAFRPGCFTLPSSARNKISSIDNDMSSAYQDSDMRVYVASLTCSGQSAIVYAGTQGNMAGTWQDSIDSIYVYVP